jgi:hypothetical protein
MTIQSVGDIPFYFHPMTQHNMLSSWNSIYRSAKENPTDFHFDSKKGETKTINLT